MTAFTAKNAKNAKNAKKGESRGSGTTNSDHHGGTEITENG